MSEHQTAQRDVGYTILDRLLPASSICGLNAHLDRLGAVGAGSRDLLNHQWCVDLAAESLAPDDLL